MMGCNQSHSLGCPKCGYPLANKKEFLIHWEREHEMNDNDTATTGSCPKCNESGFHSFDKHVSDIENSHLTPNKAIACPKCNLEGFRDGASLLDHCEKFHDYTEKPTIIVNSTDNTSLPLEETVNTKAYSNNNIQPDQLQNNSLPKVGDKVLAMWVHTKWQYFRATIRRFLPDDLQYEVDWDDQDTTGRIVDYFNLALDRSPSPKDISIDSIVLFPQGYYAGGEGGAKEEVRWHQGKVSHIHTTEDGTILVSGYHTKGKADGKLTTYKGYRYRFEGLNLSDLRIGPNIFDFLDDDDASAREGIVDDIDIKVSCAMSESPTAIKSQEIEKSPTQ